MLEGRPFVVVVLLLGFLSFFLVLVLSFAFSFPCRVPLPSCVFLLSLFLSFFCLSFVSLSLFLLSLFCLFLLSLFLSFFCLPFVSLSLFLLSLFCLSFSLSFLASAVGIRYGYFLLGVECEKGSKV